MGKNTDLSRQLANLTLAEAFRQAVLDNDHVKKLGEIAIEADPTCRTIFEDGHFPAVGNSGWPTRFENYNFAEKFSYRPYISLDSTEPPPPAEVVAAADALVKLYARLLDLLRSGKIIGTGIPENGDAVIDIPRALWSDANVFIHFLNNRLTGWTGVELKLPTTMASSLRDQSTSHATLSDIRNPKFKGGAEPTYTWDDAIDELALRLGTKGFPEKQATLISWFQEWVELPDGTRPDESTVRSFLQKRLPKLTNFIKSERRLG